MKLEPSKISD